MQLLAEDKRFSWLTSSRRSNNPPSLQMRSPLKLISMFLRCKGKRLISGAIISDFLPIIVYRGVFVVSASNINN